MKFAEAVKAIDDWAISVGATVTITRARKIDGGDGRIWDSFTMRTVGAAPGAVAKFNSDAVDVVMKAPGEFRVKIGVR